MKLVISFRSIFLNGKLFSQTESFKRFSVKFSPQYRIQRVSYHCHTLSFCQNSTSSSIYSFPFFHSNFSSGNVNKTMDSSKISSVTVGIIIIGDEILNGQTVDTNSQFLCKQLYELGIDVRQISVIGDNVESVAKEVLTFSKQFSYVITSGGVGPTHDDVTYEGVASAFDEPLVAHPELVELVQKFFKTTNPEHPAMKLAHIPKSACVNFGEDPVTGQRSTIFPVISVKNIYIFPGIPQLLQRGFRHLRQSLFHSRHRRYFTEELFLTIDEVTITPTLNRVVAEYEGRVKFGSYPKLQHSYYRVNIQAQSEDESLNKEAIEKLKDSLPQKYLINYDRTPLFEAKKKILTLVEEKSSLKEQVLASFEVLKQCLADYSPTEFAVCFNGGKDCTVLLHLCHVINNEVNPHSKLRAFCIREPYSFQQLESFVQETVNRYELEWEVVDGPIKNGITSYLRHKPQIKAVLMGTRHIDPGAEHLQHFQRTDSNWPDVMRVMPLLTWNYHDVWRFLRGLSLPYCNLYNRGYTSLGNMNNTLPNSLLQTSDPLGASTYLPAYMLQDASTERKGRISGKL